MRIKVTSLNLGGLTDWQSRIASIAQYLDEENADILLLEEVRFQAKGTYENQATELNKHLKNSYNYESVSISRFYRPSVGEPYREGLAILSRNPILRSEVLALIQAVDDKHVRLVQNVDVQIGERKVGVSNVHFSNNKYSSQQLEELLTILSKRKEARIIAGDFNIFNISEYKNFYKGYSASVDFTKYISFPSEDKTIDYMLLPTEYTYESIVAREGLSDHVALSYRINLSS